MFISPAFAHGASGVASVGGFGPLIIVAVGLFVVLVLVAEKKWRGRRLKRDSNGK